MIRLGALVRRRRRLLLGGGEVAVSEANSSLVAAAFAPDADGVTTDALTLTVEDAGGNPLAGRAVTFTVQRVFVDAAESLAEALPSTIDDDGVATSTITVYAETSAGTALPGIPAANVVLASTGTGNTLVQPSTPTTLIGSTTGTLASTVAEAKTVSATVLGIAVTDTATVTVSGTPPATVFDSEWATATGTGASAVTDGGAWDQSGGSASPNQVLNVLNTGNALGFPTTNVLRVEMNNEYYGVVEKDEAYPISTSHFARFYFRNDVDSEMSQDHAYAYNNLHGLSSSGDIQAAPFCIWTNLGDGAGFWRAGLIIPNSYPNNRWKSPALSNDTVYRYEYEFEYIGATTYRVWPRIYDAAGTLLYDSDDYLNIEDDATTLTAFNDANPAGFTLANILNGPTANAQDARAIGLGNPGPAGNTIVGEYFYFAGFAVSTTGWVGPI